MILNRPVLVLNRSWSVINVATVARALVLLWNESAKVVDPNDYQLYAWSDWTRLAPKEGEPSIRTMRLRLKVPEVVVLSEYDKMPSAIVTFSRRNIFKRDHYTCQYCGSQPSPDELSIDHVIPRSRGGESTWINCVLACVPCNKRKADRSLAEAGMKLRKAPVKPEWKPLYASRDVRIESWGKFISEAYWNLELKS